MGDIKFGYDFGISLAQCDGIIEWAAPNTFMRDLT